MFRGSGSLQERRAEVEWQSCPKLHGTTRQPLKSALLLWRFWTEGPGRFVRNEKETMNRDFLPDQKDEGEVIASWGRAKLIKYLDGKLELKGGSKEDRGEAREWMSLFWHEGVVTVRES
jgi:hypothetical protein